MKEKYVEVPIGNLEPEVLKTLIEEFIERDGTFYGEDEQPMDQKIDAVMTQLRKGDAVITWDLEEASSNIVLKKRDEKKVREPFKKNSL